MLGKTPSVTVHSLLSIFCRLYLSHCQHGHTGQSTPNYIHSLLHHTVFMMEIINFDTVIHLWDSLDRPS